MYSGSLLFFHQVQVEKESGAEGEEIVEILKNHFGQFYKLNNDFVLLYGLKDTFKLIHISFPLPFLYCIHVEICYFEIFSNSFVLPSLKYFTPAKCDVLASYAIFIFLFFFQFLATRLLL